jgi:hypothetical protein
MRYLSFSTTGETALVGMVGILSSWLVRVVGLVSYSVGGVGMAGF